MPNVHKSPMVTSVFNGKIVNAERGEVEVEFNIQPKMTNPIGLLHGGMQCTLMDDVIGITVATLGLENFSISLNLQINYLGKANIDPSNILYNCLFPNCIFISSQKEIVKEHIKINHNIDALIYWCRICDYQTNKKSSLKTHYLFKHTKSEEINWFHCSN